MIRPAQGSARRVRPTPVSRSSLAPTAAARPAAQPLVINADHVEKDLGQVVGVSDRGLRHQRNEDAFHIAVVPTDDGQVAVAIVSDGVSSAPRPDEASLTAVRTGMTLLAEGVQRGDDPAEASLTAVKAAARALAELAGAGRGAGRHVRVRRRQPGADHDLLARRQPRLLARGRGAGARRPERHDRHHRRVQADHQGRLAGRGDGHGRPGVDGRRDGVTAGPRDHPLARAPTCPTRWRTSSSSPRPGPACCWSPRTACGTTARRRPSWPPW